MAPPGPPAVSPAPDALRILLFGLPAAGKSSLLGALAQAAQVQEHLLNGRLTDLTHGLAALQKRLYDGPGQRTAEEVAPYPADFEPFTGDGRALVAHQHLGVVLIDCDGRVANDLLARRETLAETSPDGTLAREVLRADVLLLVVDCSGTLPQVDADFAEFDRFLRLLQQGRGERVEVGGLPVFLVLTKCDLLARPSDTAAAWMERIEERKRDVDGQFRDFLDRRAADASPVPFGWLDLHVWATAIQRPAIGPTPARNQEPFGVAELFRQALEQGATFRGRQAQSRRRVAWAAGGASGVAALLLALMAALFTTNRETAANDLRAKVEEIRSEASPSAADRLQGSLAELRRRLDGFLALRQDPAFPALPGADRDYVGERITELQEYIAYYEKVRQVARPADQANVDKLQAVAGELQALALPRADWEQTEAGKLRTQRLAEADALTKAVQRAKAWYDDGVEKSRELWVFARYQPSPDTPAINWHGWYDEVAALLDPSRRAPFDNAQPIPGTALTYGTALRFDHVVESRAEWEGAKDKLQRIVDLTSALGLLSDVKGRPALLVIPRPPEFPLANAGKRLREIQEAYPRYQTEFVLAGLPDAIVPSVRQAARGNYDYLLAPGREAVLHQLHAVDAGAEESARQWAAVGTWLGGNPQELSAWRELALVLARLSDANAIDPVTALADFLEKQSFSIEIQQVALEVPYRLNDVKPLAGQNLAVFHPATAAEGPAIACVPAGEGVRDDGRKVTVYKFAATGRQRVTYRPGEELWATLPLRDDRALTWTRGHSTTFQFERLHRPPRLHRVSEPSNEGTLAEGIELAITPADGVPRVPDLMPVVRPAK